MNSTIILAQILNMKQVQLLVTLSLATDQATYAKALGELILVMITRKSFIEDAINKDEVFFTYTYEHITDGGAFGSGKRYRKTLREYRARENPNIVLWVEVESEEEINGR